MADFCRRCLVDEGMTVVDADRHNDMRFRRENEPEIIWDLCEGCGRHAFDEAGQPLCSDLTESWYRNPDQDFMQTCGTCLRRTVPPALPGLGTP